MSAVTPEAVVPLLRGTFGSPYLYEPVCASTQDVLRGSSVPEGAVAITDHQTAGRGRSGKSWEDITGDALLLSVLLRPEGSQPLPQLSLVCALAVSEAVEAETQLRTAVKWPNDVLVAEGKVAGILLEADGAAVVCGIGVNVNQAAGALPANAQVPATSLRAETGAAHDRAALLATLLERLEERYGEWRRDGLAGLLPELEARNALRGRRVQTGAGPGVAESIAADGRLHVALDGGGAALVESGTVTLLE